jgi:hypothetical protein
MVAVPCFLVLRCRGSIGRDRSASVSAVGRRENLVLIPRYDLQYISIVFLNCILAQQLKDPIHLHVERVLGT